MSQGGLLALAGVWAVGLLSPGPDVLLVANRGIAKGLSRALAAAAGVVAGIEVWILASLAGLDALLREFPHARAVLSALGGVCLMFLGWQSARSAKKPVPEEASVVEPEDSGWGADFLAGLMTNLGNPKALVFFGALLVRFVPKEGGLAGQFAVWAVMTAMACAWFSALAVLLSQRSLRTSLMARMRRVHFVTGVVFLCLGALMVGEACAGRA
ncbi:Lysine exporter protein (LYSE/YGGA) [Segniliparus rotundus DSM 44985]|uniref:Lysine exporter protein (LYSE/YGGA) n=1 Tax=Segniliparus rotundus (strain ATCC BAA-972 / CDC 1076 / CIP 108378 / DSM 44985 / JCM 13578) TaxID=640132 RepID=D6Z851_SEGRD|nr:LysE family translocator [Segniliparus rotundus]ADG98131.1 Lysine exporter protein (LYSE/YGGA) [Segniliparus rotundus DSM 44985]